MSDPADPFSAWSKRRRAVAEEAAAEVEVPVAEPEEELDEAAYLEAEGLVDPDVMEEGDDFTAFMKSGVPKALRQRALRRLWRLNPVLANVDGLVEYGEDYTDAATVVENLQTAYQVGKGFLKEVLEEEPTEPTEAEEPDLEEDEPEEEPVELAELEEPEPPVEPALPADPLPTKRRMAFRFD